MRIFLAIALAITGMACLVVGVVALDITCILAASICLTLSALMVPAPEFDPPEPPNFVS